MRVLSMNMQVLTRAYQFRLNLATPTALDCETVLYFSPTHHVKTWGYISSLAERRWEIFKNGGSQSTKYYARSSHLKLRLRGWTWRKMRRMKALVSLRYGLPLQNEAARDVLKSSVRYKGQTAVIQSMVEVARAKGFLESMIKP